MVSRTLNPPPSQAADLGASQLSKRSGMVTLIFQRVHVGRIERRACLMVAGCRRLALVTVAARSFHWTVHPGGADGSREGIGHPGGLQAWDQAPYFLFWLSKCDPDNAGLSELMRFANLKDCALRPGRTAAVVRRTPRQVRAGGRRCGAAGFPPGSGGADFPRCIWSTAANLLPSRCPPAAPPKTCRRRAPRSSLCARDEPRSVARPGPASGTAALAARAPGRSPNPARTACACTRSCSRWVRCRWLGP